MGRRVKIRTLVSLAGPDMALKAGDVWEVDEKVAIARIAAGLAEPIEPPETREPEPVPGPVIETASVAPEETRPATRGKKPATRKTQPGTRGKKPAARKAESDG